MCVIFFAFLGRMKFNKVAKPGHPNAVVVALKRTRVRRTELSSLDVNETTLPLIKYSRGLQRHLDLANMEVVTENKLYDIYASEELRVPWA